MSQDYFEEASKDAKVLATRIGPEDYDRLKSYWQNKNFTLIAFMLRRFGIEFKGLTYLEALIDELSRIKEASTGTSNQQA